MTRENAILCLKGIKNYGRDTFTEQGDWQESLDMAIKALEQDPKIVPIAVIKIEYDEDKLKELVDKAVLTVSQSDATEGLDKCKTEDSDERDC